MSGISTVFNVCFPFLDIGLDIATAVEFYLHNNLVFFGWTLFLVLLPFLVRVISVVEGCFGTNAEAFDCEKPAQDAGKQFPIVHPLW